MFNVTHIKSGDTTITSWNSKSGTSHWLIVTPQGSRLFNSNEAFLDALLNTCIE